MTDRVLLLIQGLEFRRDRVLGWKPVGGSGHRDAGLRLLRYLAEFVEYAADHPDFGQPLMEILSYEARLDEDARVRGYVTRARRELRSIAKTMLASTAWQRSRNASKYRQPLTGMSTKGLLPGSTGSLLGQVEGSVRWLRCCFADTFGNAPKNADARQWSVRLDRLDSGHRDEQSRRKAVGQANGRDAAELVAEAYSIERPFLQLPGFSSERRRAAIARAQSANANDPAPRSIGVRSDSMDDVRDAVKLVTHVLSQAALRRRGRHRVLERFARFCSWYAREHILALLGQRAGKRKEAELHAYMNEFLFREGYLPLAEVSLGANRRPDTLAQAQRQLEGDRPSGHDDVLLIEAKQSLGQNLTDAKLSDFIGQAADYANTLAPLVPDINRTVYLVIVHDRPFNYGVEPAIERGSVEVRLVLVDLGDVPVSKRKAMALSFVPMQARDPAKRK